MWLTSVLRNRYPGIEVLGMTVVELRNGHTTKLRVTVELNTIGIAAGIPRQVCPPRRCVRLGVGARPVAPGLGA